MSLVAMFVATFIELKGPDGQRVWVNPDQIINIREPRSSAHFAPNTRCIILTADGKLISTPESCTQVRQRLQ